MAVSRAVGVHVLVVGVAVPCAVGVHVLVKFVR
jgi:hypothetical protein